MKCSTERILTTHTGSLPRPEPLTRLYIERARGEPVDPAEIDRPGATPCAIVAQADRGRHRYRQQWRAAARVLLSLSPAADERVRRQLARSSRGDVERYPDFRSALAQRPWRHARRSSIQRLPKAVGEVTLYRRQAIKAECARFPCRARRAPGGFVEPFMTAPSPGIVARR